MKLKLKLVAASMSVLGLISCPALAAAHAKHKHHMMKKHHVAATQQVYKDMGALPAPVCPVYDQFTAMLDAMDQNTGRARPTEDCNKLIAFAGGANFDAKWGNRSAGYNGENVQRLSLNDVYLNIYGNVNEWTKAFASISYNDATPDDSGTLGGGYSNSSASNTLSLEQAFVRISNFDESPLFAQLGKQFQPFGRYMIHPITRSMDQVLSESLKTSAEVGFLTRMGLHGAVYAFDGALNERSASSLTSHVAGHAVTDWGVELGIDQPSDQLGYDLGVGYMYNMTGVNDVADAIEDVNGGSYHNHVGAVALYGDVNSGPFSVNARYVSAVQHFDPNDLPRTVGSSKGAKPWAGNIQAGYGFNAWSKNQNVYLGYQASGDAVAIFLPKSRWLAGYNVDMWKSTNLGIQLDHDNAYSVASGGLGGNTNVVSFRAAVKFG